MSSFSRSETMFSYHGTFVIFNRRIFAAGIMTLRTHYMETPEHKWSVGELVSLTWNERQLKKSGSTSYAELVSSSYICVREATDEQPGILVKVLGKVTRDQILLVSGTPFCKDDRDYLFRGKCYYSYPFPLADDLKEALDIIVANPSLQQRFEEESMHFNPSSTFWVRGIAGRMLWLKKLQFFDASTGQLSKALDDTPHYRLTIAFFNKEELSW